MRRTERERFRKKVYTAPADRDPLASSLRRVSESVQRREFVASLDGANRLLANPALARHDKGRVLALVGDSEYKRGAYTSAIGIYQQAATLCLGHHLLWLRPLLGQVRAYIKMAQVDDALLIARHTFAVAKAKFQQFDEEVRSANRRLAEDGEVMVPMAPPRVSVVATRLGFLFLREGELGCAQEFFECALQASKRGACRAREGLAQIALARGEHTRALEMAGQAIRIGRYTAKTVESWNTLIAARRNLGGWQISEKLLDGLRRTSAPLRARTVLSIVRELRKNDMRQWQVVAQKWMQEEGSLFPVVETEMRKMLLASTAAPQQESRCEELAGVLLETQGLSATEWLAAAKTVVEMRLQNGESAGEEKLIAEAVARYGERYAPRITHALALVCAKAKRTERARELLAKNVRTLKPDHQLWSKSLWSLARVESSAKRHVEAAALYKQIGGSDDVPLRFKLQAKLLWAKELVAAGQGDALLEARPEIEELLRDETDPIVLMDFARQLAAASQTLRPWAETLFGRGSGIALERFYREEHPSVAIDILFHLARRQIYDFGQSAKALHLWESLDAQKREWLWSPRESFWAYLGLLVEAYSLSGPQGAGDAFARDWLDDPATPPLGRVHVGIPYCRWLMNCERATEALPIFDQLVVESPTHILCVTAWYWKALQAYKHGNTTERDRCVQCLHLALGSKSLLPRDGAVVGKALLLQYDRNIERAAAQEKKYSRSDWENFDRRVAGDLKRLP